MTTDVSNVPFLEEKHPSKIYLLRYEDFITNAYRTMDKLLHFLEIPPEPIMDLFLESHMGRLRHNI